MKKANAGKWVCPLLKNDITDKKFRIANNTVYYIVLPLSVLFKKWNICWDTALISNKFKCVLIAGIRNTWNCRPALMLRISFWIHIFFHPWMTAWSNPIFTGCPDEGSKRNSHKLGVILLDWVKISKKIPIDTPVCF